ncbi:hypothetical protein F4775DRAFT_588019 [Biscogniauxia sp. FL1348]|nr:hypothetical protein F4775DRAFT_588019 [Biscogniauxia sp. FL1348]
MVFSSTTIPQHSPPRWDPATASHTPASRGYHSSHDDDGYSFRQPQPLAYEFPSRAASPLEIWGIATGTCFLAALLCWLLWVGLCGAVGAEKKRNPPTTTTTTYSSSHHPWRAPTGTGTGAGSSAPAAGRRRWTYVPDEQPQQRPSAFGPRLFLAGLKTANASAEELLGAARRRSVDVAAGVRRAVSTTTTTATASSPSSPAGGRPRAVDVEEGLAGLGSSSSSGPEEEEEHDRHQQEEEEDIVVVDIGDGGRGTGNGDSPGSPFLRRRGKGDTGHGAGSPP